MAREMTPQETQDLSRIREQLVNTNQQVTDAIRTRQGLESQLRDIQQRIASPDGVTSSQEFVDDVSRLRREIQTAMTSEQDATVARNRYSAEELRILNDTSSQPPGVTGQQRSRRGGAATVIRARVGLDALRDSRMRYERNRTARAALENKLVGDIKKSAIIVFISALIVAAIADVLSLIDAGWIVSWMIPGIVWFMVRRVNGINTAGDAIVAAHASARRELAILQQRLRPAIRASRNPQLLLASRTTDISFKGHSYVSTYVRDTLITQLVELIPIIDWLPLYMGQVIKVLIDQNIAYQKVKKLMPDLQFVHQQVDTLEQFEIQYAAQRVTSMNRERVEHVPVGQRASVAQVSRITPATSALAPQLAT